MHGIGSVWLKVILFFVMLAGSTGYASSGPDGGAGNTALAAVEQSAEPTLPAFIDSITPRPNTTIEVQGQISIQFRQPLVPLGRIDQAETVAVLKYFSIQPAIPGKFRLANPNLVVFEPEESLPAASRVEVLISKGLADLKGDVVSDDIRWTFEVAPLSIQISGPSIAAPLQPAISIYTNAPVALGELKKALTIDAKDSPAPDFKLVADSSVQRYTVRRTEQVSPDIAIAELTSQSVDAAAGTSFNIIFTAPLEKATNYSVNVANGLLPAYGNLPLVKQQIWRFWTYKSLEASLQGSVSTVLSGTAPKLVFNNPLMEGAEKFIKVSPLPKARNLVYTGYDGIGIDDRYFKAKTRYTFTIQPGLKDIFGQEVTGQKVFTLTTGDYLPGLWAPEGVSVLQPSLLQKLTVHYVNTSGVKGSLRALGIRELQTLGKGRDIYAQDLLAVLPARNKWKSLPASKSNRLVSHDYALKEQLKNPFGVLAYAFSTALPPIDGVKRQQDRIGLMARTDLGIVSQWLPQQGSVQVYSLGEGTPVADARVNVYSLSGASPCASGVTDVYGGARWDTADLAQCLSESGIAPDGAFTSPPHLLMEVKKDKDWSFAFSHINQRFYYGGYSESVPGEDEEQVYSWEDWSGKNESRGVLFSDRFMYKPGEQARFTGMVRFMRLGQLTTPKNHTFNLELVNPDGVKTDLGSVTSNAYGSFSTAVAVPADAKLGFWQITAKSATPAYTLSGSFRVAEFRAPPFKVSTTVDSDTVILGDEVSTHISADYLHGAPLADAKARLSVTRDQFSPSFEGYEEYSFGKPYIYSDLEKQPVFDYMVLQQGLTLDAQGQGLLKIRIDDLPYPARYTVEAEVSDSSNASLSDRSVFTAYPDKQLAGVHIHNYVITKDQPLEADIVVLDLDGKPVSGANVALTLKRVEWNSALRALSNGLEMEQHPTLEVITTQTLQSGAAPLPVSLMVPKGGEYVLEAVIDANPATLAAGELFVAGDAEASWYQSGEDSVTLKLNKTSYKVGDTASILVQSPYPQAEVLLSVLRDRIFHSERQAIQGSSTLFSFRITPDMVPNAQVQVMLTRRGDIKTAKNLVRLGSAYFDVNHDQLALKIGITPERATLEPGEHQTLKLHLSDVQDQPVQGQVSVIVANEAIIQLNKYRPPNLLDTFYASFPVYYLTSDTRDYVQLLPHFKPFDKGWGYGGGFSQSLANSLLRKNFQPNPFFRLDAVTDAAGNAEVGFDMPDDLTTWRVLAVAADDAQRFGNGDATFKTSKTLIADPVLPRFARLYDTFQGGVNLVNSSGKTGTVRITGEVSPPLSFVTPQGLAQTRQWQATLAGTPLAERVPIRVTGVGLADVRFRVEGEGELQGFSDGFKLQLGTALHQPLEATAQVGATTDAVTRIPLKLREGVAEDIGGLTVQAASTLMPAVTEPLDYMIHYLYGCLEQTATRLIALADMQWLSTHYGFAIDKKKLQDDVAGAMQNLLKMRTSSGGFAFWPGQTDAAYAPINAHAARALQALAENGFEAPDDLKKQLAGYLDSELRAVKKYPDWQEIALDELRGLEALGQSRDDYLQEIFSARESLGRAGNLKLALVLSSREKWQKEYTQVMQELRNNLVFDARGAQLSGHGGNDIWAWLGDPQVQQALALRAFASYPEADDTLLDRLLRSLLDARKNGLWNNTYTNSQALEALVAFARAREMTRPDYTLDVKLGERSIMQEVFDSFRQTEVFTPMRELPGGASELTFTKTGAGKLHYLASYKYALLDPAAGRDSGINVQRTLSEIDAAAPLATWQDAVPEAPLILEAGKTYRIKLHVTLKQWSSHIALSDLLPAGLEAVDTQLATSSNQYQTDADWSFSYKETGDRRVDAFLDQAEAGSYDLEYFARAVTPGRYTWPGGEAMLMYTPETFGRTAASRLEIRE